MLYACSVFRFGILRACLCVRGVFVCACIYIRMCVCMDVFVYMYVYM